MITISSSIDGLDVEGALTRLKGKEEMYTRLVKYFLQSNELDALAGHIGNGDTNAASVIAHTIKGAAANLSAQEVCGSAGALEQALKNGADITEAQALFDGLKSNFETLSASCAPFIE